MKTPASGDDPYFRLFYHFLRRQLHAKAGEAIIAAVEREILVSRTFSYVRSLGVVFHPGRSAAGKTESEIRLVLRQQVTLARKTTCNYAVEDGEITLVQQDPYPLTKFSGGRSALTKSETAGKSQYDPTSQLMTRAALLRIVQQSASPPDAADLVVLALVADAVARSGVALADVFRILRRPRPIISVTCSLKGFEDHFNGLLDRGFLLPGAVLRADGYEPLVRADLKANLKGEGRRRVTCFAGKDFDQELVEEWTLQAARSTRPILCVAEFPSALPSKLVTAADLNLACGPLTSAILRDLIRALLGDVASDALDEVDCSRLGIADVALAVCPGRTPREAVAMLEKLAAEPSGALQSASSGCVTRSSKKSSALGSSGSVAFRPERQNETTELIPMIETLSGYGKARDWAMSLKQELKAWRSGDLRWDELSASLLLSGPPGTGKTLFARALCNSLQLPVFCKSAANWLQASYLGDVIKCMSAAFEEAIASGPAILFIDEIDGIGARSNPLREHAHYWNAIINKLLELLDGATRLNGIVVVGATNCPQQIDPALLRAGRLHPHIELGLPDTAALAQILRHHLGDDLEALVSDACVQTTSTSRSSGMSPRGTAEGLVTPYIQGEPL